MSSMAQFILTLMGSDFYYHGASGGQLALDAQAGKPHQPAAVLRVRSEKSQFQGLAGFGADLRWFVPGAAHFDERGAGGDLRILSGLTGTLSHSQDEWKSQ